MQIPKDERSPRYYGAVSRACGERVCYNPYHHKDDRERNAQWTAGWQDGQISPYTKHELGN